MNLLKYVTAAGASLVFIGAFTTAQATSTDVVLNLEGNPTCSSLGENGLVQLVKDSNPGGTQELILPLPNGGGNQKLSYTVESIGGIDQITTWNITEVNTNDDTSDLFYTEVNAINYIILKAQGGNIGARVFHYGTSENVPGAITDSELISPSANLAAVSFCYGITTGIPVPVDPPIVLSDLESCEVIDPNEDGIPDLYTTGVVCPDPILDINGKVLNEQLIINMALNDPQFGFNLSTADIRACTCNSNLKPCNPELGALRVNALGEYVDAATGLLFVDQNGDLIDSGNGPGITADDLSQQERTCLEFSSDGTGVPTGVNERVPFHIEGVENPDSYVCYTIGGVRTCYGHY